MNIISCWNNDNSYSGIVSSNHFSKHLRNELFVTARSTENNETDVLYGFLVENISSMSVLMEIVGKIRVALMCYLVIYIGMTHKQSLRKRLKQHLNKETQF